MGNSLLERAIKEHQAGRFSEAETLYRSVLAAEEKNADALALLGCLLADQKRVKEALPMIEKAIALDPSAGLFYFYLGNICQAASDNCRAVEAYQKAVDLQPNTPLFRYNLGNALRLADRWEEAGKAYADVLSLDSSHPQARNNLALVHEHQGRLIEALEELQKVVRSAPDYGDGWLNLCRVADKQGDFEVSLTAGLRCVTLMPENPDAYLGLGVALNRLERHEEALDAYKKAVEYKPDWVEVWDNLGQTFQFLGRLDEAEAAYRKTIELAGQDIPDEKICSVPESAYGNRHWHLALLELLKGDYKNGFARYRARFNELNVKRALAVYPVWQGETLAGKTILVSDEQGMGDCLMLARYLPLLKERGARVKFLVQAPLVPLFEGWRGTDEVIARGEKTGDLDFHASIFDLPHVFGTTLETIPSQVPYLPTLEPSGETRLESSDKKKVGIVWAGAPKHKHDARRSIPLQQFASLFARKDIQFYNLNRDMRPGDSALLLAHENVTDLVPRLRHFGDLARFVAQCDLIVTCDTATAHLAGGMGKPVWTLLPFAPDWRWLTDREDSVWYPTMRLFRQRKSGDWAEVMNRVGEVLKTF